MPRRFGFGLGFNLSRSGGGGIPPEPSGFIAKYISSLVSSFTLDGSNNVSQWDDQTTPQFNLTQANSSLRPVLFEESSEQNNYVRFDGSDDVLTGLPAQAGDFTYVFRNENNSQGNVVVLSGGNAKAIINQDSPVEKIQVISDSGSLFELIYTGNPQDQNVFSLRRTGDTLELFVNSYSTDFVDVSGESFSFTDLGGNDSSISNDISYLYLFPTSINQSSINWFSYLRDVDGNILLPPLLPEEPDQQKIFQFIIKTDNAGTSNDDQFTLPLISTGNYDFNIEWGDGSSDSITTFNDPALTHTYATAGTYTILITGNLFEYIYFNNSGDRLKMLEILRWDLLSYGLSGTGSFYGCENLVFSSTRSPQTGTVQNLASAFRDTPLSSLPENIDFSSVTNLNRAFPNTSLSSLPENIDFSSVTNLAKAFPNTPLSSLPENIDLSSVTDFSNSFQGCNLNSQGIEVFLSACVANGRSNLDTNLSGGNNLGFSSWSAQALSDYNTLISRGWTITTNP